MKGDPLRLHELIESIADGRPVDWDGLSTRADASERRLLQQLRLVAGVADLHRNAIDEDLPSTRGTDVPDVSGAPRSWGHLLLRERLGEGAFGEVYRARDAWLDREVALKLLKASASERVPVTRLLREARTLALVRHPNVVSVHGADMHDGRVGLWMELVRGRTLAQIVATEGTFSAREATIIGQELCRALAAVHAAGIVHRDVKAQNVMRESGGRLVLMDFGAGGTPVYLAPEVLAGSEATVASDVYATGVLLYYLVTGRYHISGTSVATILAAHGRGDRQRLADARPDLPDEFVAIVERALHPNSRDRYRTAGELLDALAGRSAINESTLPPRSAAPLDRDRAIAVLPFVDLSAEKHLDYFCEGIAEEIINALTSVPGVRVVARGSAFKFASSVEDVGEVGSLLNVRAVLQGSVRTSGDRLRIVARLVETASGSQAWSKRFDCRLDDVFAVQDEIATAAVQAVGGRVTHEQEAGSIVGVRTVRDFDAYTLYLKGRHCWNQRTEKTLKKSVEYFLAALEKQSTYPEALSGLAEAYATLGLYGVLPPHEIMPRAKECAARAIAVAETLSSPHATTGCIAAVYDWNGALAERHFRRAFELNPYDSVAHHWYGINYLVPRGQFDAARGALRRAAETDPLSMAIHFSFGLTSYFAADYVEARREIEETLELDPGASTAHLFLGLTLVELRDYDEAVREIETASRLSPSPEMTAALGYAFGRAGRRERALEVIRELQALSSERYLSASLIAQVHVALGATTDALDALDRALSARACDLAWLAVRPVFDDLRGEKRFAEILTAVTEGQG